LRPATGHGLRPGARGPGDALADRYPVDPDDMIIVSIVNIRPPAKF